MEVVVVVAAAAVEEEEEEVESRASSWDMRSSYDGGLGEMTGRSGAVGGVWKAVLDAREGPGCWAVSSGADWWASAC